MAYLEELLPNFRKGEKIRLKSWGEDTYVRFFTNEGVIINNHDKLQVLYTDELMSNEWEIYVEPIDWDLVIKNKCLCWFWDDGELHVISKLVCFDSSSKYKFTDERSHDWENCRPVRKDEVTFYEDKEDVL